MHYLLPFVILAMVCAHLLCLHYMGSGSASVVPGSSVDGEAFMLYYYKDRCCTSAMTCMLCMRMESTILSCC